MFKIVEYKKQTWYKNASAEGGAMNKVIENMEEEDDVCVHIQNQKHGRMWSSCSPSHVLKLIQKNIGMYEDSISLLDNYTNVQYEAITDEMEIASDVVRKSAKINGLPAQIIAFDADVEGIDVPITYYYTIYQGSKNIYLMLSWTLKSRRTTYLPIMEKMSKSFRLMTDIQ